MDGGDRRHQRRVRAAHARERRDLACVIHPHLEHAEARVGRHARQRQRHAPVIVVGSGRGVGFAAGRQHRAQHLLGGRLADRTGHGDDPRLRSRARGDAQPLHRAQGVLDREHWPVAGELMRPLARHDSRRRARFEGARDMVVAVMRVAPDGDEEVARLKRPAVDRDAAHSSAQRRARGRAKRGGQFGEAPERGHRAASSAARASSASENGRIRVADDLPGLVALAGDQKRIAAKKHRNARADGGGPVADLDRQRRGGENLRPDRLGLLGARIVVGHDRDVGCARRDLAHDRPLARVAVAAATEHKHESPGHEGPQRRERLFERVGLVRIIDEDARAANVADALEAPRRALQRLQRREHRVRFATRGDAERRRRPARWRSGSRRPAESSRESFGRQTEDRAPRTVPRARPRRGGSSRPSRRR